MKDKTESNKDDAEIKIATTGDKVLFHYKGTFGDGELFDDSRKGSSITPPLKVLLGSNRLLEAFENAMIGMKKGDIKSVYLKPEEAFGTRKSEAYVVAPKEKFPPNYEFVIGGFVEGNAMNGRKARARIESIGESTITLDMNHPLAGKDINYEIELIEVLERSDNLPDSIAKPNKPKEADCKGCKDKSKLPNKESIAKQRAALRKAAVKQRSMEPRPPSKTTTKASSALKKTNIKRKRTSSSKTRKPPAKTTKKS